ncbi:MAG: hypothetical protein QN173_07995 [Armatimonadota bacterium]|nr:hypothetical protein [Armatimonadota bacterium]MDR7402115.1 hypothetical protein [Armatimonadota bacterium]MDR7404092.1 hypothetical protein [Armatimonadota bacterium]MDR7437683.1 hypothetical protein [Armatimonadota bacterium]MDR7472404.1 hypothetical protein [Armatimonadota bacterium]
MRRVIAALLVGGVLLGPGPLSAQEPIRVAVVEFADDSVDGFRIGASRMHAEFAELLARSGGGRLQVVPVAQVESALRARGVGPEDLSRPFGGSALAAAVGARWLVRGRWTVLEVDRPEVPPVPDDLIRPVLVHAALEVQVLDVTERRLVMRDLVSTTTVATGIHSLRDAAREVLRRAAARVAGL